MNLKLKTKCHALADRVNEAVSDVGAAFLAMLDEILVVCGGLTIAVGFGLLFLPAGVIVLGVEMTLVGAVLARHRADKGRGD